MKRKRYNTAKGVDYGDFSSPYIGIGVMIFVQADRDLYELNGREYRIRNGSVLYKSEIMRFLNSKWAKVLASEIGLEQVDLDNYVRAYA
jgi:ABC-type amino acid transport substrate-binding protein